MRARIQLIFLGVLLTAIGATAQSSGPNSAPTSAPAVDSIVSHMQTAMADRNHDRAYSVTREYKLTPEDPSKASRVVAQVNVVPGKREYNITEGSGQAEKIVRKVLDHETEAASQAHPGVALSTENYSFAYDGTEPIDGHSCYVLQLTPKHDAKDVVKGKAWVDTETYLVRKIAGTPAKSPSWWIKDVQVTLHYKEVEGLWLQDSSQAIAEVRIVGRHTLTSRSVDVRTDAEFARNNPQRSAPRKATRRADPAMLGAGVFGQR
jgi:outer membrane lipoprotein-sorting protein